MRKIEPSGYTLASDLFEDFDSGSRWRWLVIGNLWALLPLALAVLILWLPYQFYATLGAPLAVWSDPDWSAAARWIVGALIVAMSIALHEGLHALALIALGYRAKLRYKMKDRIASGASG